MSLQNAYHTLESLTFVLPSGTTIDAARPEADDLLRGAEPVLWQGLRDLKARVEADAALAARIRAKYRMKNTTGYALNALLDFARPVDVFAHLLIGSEGTLGFIAEAVLRTVPDLPVKYTGLLLFPDLYAACRAIVPLNAAGAKALEVMDRAALRSVEDETGVPDVLRALPPGAAGLLAEFQAQAESDRPSLEADAARAVAGLALVSPPLFTHDPAGQALLWKVRKGMFPSVGAVRKSGTTVIIEDVAFPVERLADAAVALNALFEKHGYDEGIVFGHARDGNLHFVITQSFRTDAEVARYARFLDDVVDLVVNRFDGALKAEHGTGRNMAPFVETEWGPEAAAVMRRVKELADPRGLLNPGVILNADPRAHLKNLKPLPSVEEEVDRCIECGFCEPLCPSRDLTTTPRQRIAVRREIARPRRGRDRPGAARRARGGLSVRRPRHVRGGRTLRDRVPRENRHGPPREALPRPAPFAGREPDRGHRGTRASRRRSARCASRSRAGHAFGPLASASTRAVRRLGLRVPLWSPPMPRPARAMPRTPAAGAAAVYVPSCLTRTMGTLPGEPDGLSLPEALVAVAARAGAPVVHPDGRRAGRAAGCRSRPRASTRRTGSP